MLFGDLQYRYSDFDYDGSVQFDKLKWNFGNFKAGINYIISENTNIYYSFGVSGREPTRNDLFNGEDNLPEDALGNPVFSHIHPEYVKNHELGTKLLFENGYLSANIYLMNFENEITLNGQYGPNGLPLHGSVAKSFRSGVELDFKIQFFSNFYYTNTSSYSYNQISENGVEFSPILTPSFLMNQTLAYQNKKIHAGTVLKYQSESYIDFENVNETPSFFTIDVFGIYSFKSFDFRLAVNNLSNQKVIANGYIGIDGTPLYFIQAPINFSGGITWKF